MRAIFLTLVAVLAVLLGFNAWLSSIGAAQLEYKAGGKAGDLLVLTDTNTGCQYLATSAGGLTPRVDKHGDHLGCPWEER